MQTMRKTTAALILAWSVASAANAVDQATGPLTPLNVEHKSGQLVITRGTLPVANYVYRDEEIKRPFWANVHAPNGLAITRRHPPQPGADAVDHVTMHPGIWLAFGDLGGHDFWRNKDRVAHVEFLQPPQSRLDGQDSVVTFAVRNRYFGGGQVICEELSQQTIRATPAGYLLAIDSQFSAEQPFAFGDQEEMGLGVRLASPVVVKGGTGTIVNSAGDKNEKGVWGQQADWCDYGGTLTTMLEPRPQGAVPVAKQRAGLLLVPHPQNFRRSWMHARDYGLLVANPFGQRAFTKGAVSRVEVAPGTPLRLRFGVWAYSVPANADLNLPALAADYVRLASAPK